MFEGIIIYVIIPSYKYRFQVVKCSGISICVSLGGNIKKRPKNYSC